jgi:hypothetical protein
MPPPELYCLNHHPPVTKIIKTHKSYHKKCKQSIEKYVTSTFKLTMQGAIMKNEVF